MTTTGQPISTRLVSLVNNNLRLIDFELYLMAQRVHILTSGRSMVLTELIQDVFHHQIAIVRHFRQTRVADFWQIHFHSFANSPRHRGCQVITRYAVVECSSSFFLSLTWLGPLLSNTISLSGIFYYAADGTEIAIILMITFISCSKCVNRGI